MFNADEAFWLIVMGIAAALIVMMWLIYWVYRAKALEREERRLMIERGMTPSAPSPVGWPGVKIREMELQAEERRLLIEKGLEISALSGAPNAGAITDMFIQLLPKRGAPQPERYLYRGLKALAFGLGLAAAYVIFKRSGINASDEARNWFLFFAILSPFFVFYGIGSLAHYQLTKDKPREEASAPGPLR